jgi:molybdopterin-guanine dinucleotide biosynthesis protein A
MIPDEKIVGCILAGGRSSRMGTDKSLLKFGGTFLIERAANVMRNVFAPVVVASDRTDAYAFLDLPILPDIKKNCGPLGGIHSAFVQTKAQLLFVLACDMPFVSADLIRFVAAQKVEADAIVPTMDGRIQPLCGLYSRTGLFIIEQLLDRGDHALMNLLTKLKHTIVQVAPDLPFYEPDMLDNFNEPADVERGKYLIRGEGVTRQ